MTQLDVLQCLYAQQFYDSLKEQYTEGMPSPFQPPFTLCWTANGAQILPGEWPPQPYRQSLGRRLQS